MVVPQACVGALVGPSGETIRELQARHDAFAAVEPRDPNAAFHPFRIVTVAAATHLALAAAMGEAMLLVSQDPRYGKAAAGINSTCFRTLPVPTRRVGMLLGMGGKHVQSLQEVLRVRIGVGNIVDANGYKFVSIWGPVESVEVAVRTVLIATSAPPLNGAPAHIQRVQDANGRPAPEAGARGQPLGGLPTAGAGHAARGSAAAQETHLETDELEDDEFEES